MVCGFWVFWVPSSFAIADPPPPRGVVPGWAGTQTHILGTPTPGVGKNKPVPIKPRIYLLVGCYGPPDGVLIWRGFHDI